MIVNRYICERYIKQCDFIADIDMYYRATVSMRKLSIAAHDVERVRSLDTRLMVIKRVRRALDRGVTAIQKGQLTPSAYTIVLPSNFSFSPKNYIRHVIEKDLYKHL